MRDLDLVALLAPVGFIAFALFVASLARLTHLGDGSNHKDKIDIGFGRRRLVTVTNSQLTLALAVVTAAISVVAIARD